ncbi:MAG: M23 family peptidase [Nitrosomonas sp.]|uniref:M23 family metallopeptidase n=1 Tax=Nitrosomonas sp. TaxID=42353 RepID=UPI0032EDC941
MKIHITSNIPLKIGDLADSEFITSRFPVEIKFTKAKFRTKYIEKFKEVHGDFDWIREITPSGYDVRGFITSKQQLKDGGIKGHIGMYDNQDNDMTMDFYSGLAPTLDRRAKLNGFSSNLVWQLAHEISHGLAHQLGKPEIIKLVHDAEAKGELRKLFLSLADEYEKRKADQQKQISLLKQVVNLLVKLKIMSQPVKNPFPNFPISQKFGVRDPKYYKRTKHHIGTDWATPIGTPIPAPVGGVITYAGYHTAMGNYLELKDTTGRFWYFLHLDKPAVKKTVKQGDIMGYTGNTGLSEGPHCHVECWKQTRDLSLLTEQNFRDYVYDVETIIK